MVHLLHSLPSFLNCPLVLRFTPLFRRCRTDEARKTGFANELGVEDTVRFLKNISGLWLIQECKREWEKEGASFGYDALAALASEAPAFTSLVDADAPA